MHKLVRDNIPEILKKENPKVLRYRTLSTEDFKRKLIEKVLEESNELCDANTEGDIYEEIADLGTVLINIVNVFKIPDGYIRDYIPKYQLLIDNSGYLRGCAQEVACKLQDISLSQEEVFDYISELVHILEVLFRISDMDKLNAIAESKDLVKGTFKKRYYITEYVPADKE